MNDEMNVPKVWDAIKKVREDLPNIEKLGTVKGGGLNYKFLRAEDVIREVKLAANIHGLVFIPTEVKDVNYSKTVKDIKVFRQLRADEAATVRAAEIADYVKKLSALEAETTKLFADAAIAAAKNLEAAKTSAAKKIAATKNAGTKKLIEIEAAAKNKELGRKPSQVLPVLRRADKYDEMLESKTVETSNNRVLGFTQVWRVVCVEDASECSVEVRCAGEDQGDKAPYKANTGGLKYMFAMLFQIDTGDEPENADANRQITVEEVIKELAVYDDETRLNAKFRTYAKEFATNKEVLAAFTKRKKEIRDLQKPGR